MRTDALEAHRPPACFTPLAWALLALWVVSTPAASLAQQKSAGPGGASGTAAAPTTAAPAAQPAPHSADTEYPYPVTDTAPPHTPSAPPAATPGPGTPLGVGNFSIPDLTNRQNFSAALQLIILLTVLSLAPAILIMMTCFTRIIIVLSLLRQALGTQQLPPNQVMIGLAMFMTFLVMGPTWKRVNNDALKPYLDGTLDPQSALAAAEVPVREFMIRQIESARNEKDVRLFHRFSGAAADPENWSDVSTVTLVPGFMLSELKTAFLMGFKVYLPFLIIDIVISTILISMGMMMLPPVMISLPFKLLLFVLVDGWHLITINLMGSFG